MTKDDFNIRIDEERQPGRIDGEKEEKNEERKKGAIWDVNSPIANSSKQWFFPKMQRKEDRSKSREWCVKHHHSENERGSTRKLKRLSKSNNLFVLYKLKAIMVCFIGKILSG